MKTASLKRVLLYCGYSDAADYLKDSPMNRYLYKQLLMLRPEHSIETPILTILNEVYYQCVSIGFDPNPGEDITQRYLGESREWLKSEKACELVFCIVWAIYSRKKNLDFHEECFMSALKPLINDSFFFQSARNMVDYMNAEGIYAPDAFQPMPIPIKEIPMNIGLEYFKKKATLLDIISHWFGVIVEDSSFAISPWRIITDDYSFGSMEKYVKLYHTREDQLELLERIKQSCYKKELKAHQESFTRLQEAIENCMYEHKYEGDTIVRMRYLQSKGLPLDEMTEQEVKGYQAPDGEEYDRMFAAGLQRTMDEEEEREAKENALQIMRERDALKSQLEQSKRDYESDLARIETQYRKEIEKLKAELAKKSAEQPKEGTNNTEPKELSFTVTEIVNDAKKWFHESGALEISNMLYRLTIDHNYLEGDVWNLINSIIPAVEKRIAPNTTIDIPSAGQVYISPQKVINHASEEDEKK